jgi:hypothetical protein
LDEVEKDSIQGVAFCLEHPGLYRDAVLAQNINSLSCNKGIGIAGAYHHTSNARFQDGIRTGGLLALVTARLQGHIHGGTPGICLAIFQGMALSVKLSIPDVPSLADDLSIPNDDGPYHGIGGCPAYAPLCQFQRQTHIVCIVHFLPPQRKNALNKSFKAS